MIVKNFLSICLAMSYVFFALGLSGEDLGLPVGFTTRNMGLILISFAFFIIILFEKKITFRTNKYISFIVLIVSSTILWILLSFLFSTYKNLVEYADILAWITIPIVILFTFKISKYLIVNTLINIVVLSQFIVLLITFFWIFNSLGEISNFIAIRQFINLNISVGLNRYLNGIIFLNIISIIVVLGYCKSNKLIYFLSFINVIISLYLAFISGARQSLLAIIITFVVSFIMNLYTKDIKRINFKSIGFILILLISLIGIIQLESINQWIEDRYIDKTTDQLTTEDIRTTIYKYAINDAKENFLFGTGPGTYHQVSKIGMHTHNGYLYMINNFGFFPAILIIFSFLVITLNVFRKKKVIIDNKRTDMFVITFTSIIVFLLIMNMFNDLITTLAFWMSIVLLIESFSNKKKSANIG